MVCTAPVMGTLAHRHHLTVQQLAPAASSSTPELDGWQSRRYDIVLGRGADRRPTSSRSSWPQRRSLKLAGLRGTGIGWR